MAVNAAALEAGYSSVADMIKDRIIFPHGYGFWQKTPVSPLLAGKGYRYI